MDNAKPQQTSYFYDGRGRKMSERNWVSRGKDNLRNKLALLVLYTLKFLVVVICLGFVCQGLFFSGQKFLSGQTSIAISVNESTEVLYPSVTFCRKFKNDSNLIDLVEEEASNLGNTNNQLSKIDIKQIIDKARYKRTDFLSIFSHPEHGDPRKGIYVLFNDSYWKESIPHPSESGVCYTYNPNFTTYPGEWFGIRFGIRFFGFENRSKLEKEEMLSNIDIFIHDKDDFIFHKENDRPSVNKLDLSWFRYQREMSTTLSMRKFTRLSTDERPCYKEKEKDHAKFRHCVQRFFAKKRGCQLPWEFNDNINDVKVCETLQELINGENKMRNENFPVWSTNELSSRTKCPSPCTSLDYDPRISFRNIKTWRASEDNDPDWVVYLWFKNLQFQVEEEFRVCDWTCLLGEVGGNLGFFLGGSILFYVNYIINPLKEKL